jgi:hypothetical protein
MIPVTAGVSLLLSCERPKSFLGLSMSPLSSPEERASGLVGQAGVLLPCLAVPFVERVHLSPRGTGRPRQAGEGPSSSPHLDSFG